MQGSDVIVSLKGDTTNLHASLSVCVCVSEKEIERDAGVLVKINPTNEILREKSG